MSAFSSSTRRARAMTAVLTCAALLVVAAAPGARADTGTEAVAGWIDVTLQEIASHRTNPPRASRILGLVSVAMDRASATGHSAVHGAAAAVLDYAYPDRSSFFDARAAQQSTSARQFERGRAVGAAVIERGRTDGSDAVFAGARPTGEAFWRETPPAFAAPLEPAAGQWRPWNLASGDAFRPPPPPRPGEARFDADLAEVIHVTAHLTERQREIALFWADGAGTVTPPGHWNAIAAELVRAAGLSHKKAARVFALLNTAQSDAFIAAWDAKFFYWSLRPVTVIRATDPAWTPLIATPPFPGYVSGHSTTSGAASTVLRVIFPERSGDLDAMAAEAAVSRLYGGIHFAADNEAGLELGKRVGAEALRVYGSE